MPKTSAEISVEAARDRYIHRVDDAMQEQFDWPAGTRFRCVKCHLTETVYPQRTVDARWVFVRCRVCHKTQIAEVVSPG